MRIPSGLQGIIGQLKDYLTLETDRAHLAVSCRKQEVKEVIVQRVTVKVRYRLS